MTIYRSEITKQKMRDNHKGFLGLKHSELTKQIQREKSSGVNNGMFGKKHTETSKQKISENRSGKPAWNKGKRGLYKASEETKQKQREWDINNPNRTFRDTKIELKVETELKRRNINYQKQIPLCKVAIVDFYLPEYRVVIQCDGCYWHGCPKHNSNWIKNKERDLQQDRILTFNGFNVYRFWEHEINGSVGDCINKIKL